MDFYAIQEDLKNYLLNIKNENGVSVFSEQDFNNEFSNIGVMWNFLSYLSMTLENKMRLYKDNSILASTTDLNLARKIAKIVHNYDWKPNQPAKVYLNVDWDNSTGDYTLQNGDYIVIPALTKLSIGGTDYISTDEIIIRQDSGGVPIIEGEPLIANEGSYSVKNYTVKNNLIISFTEASKIYDMDVFVEKEVLNETTGQLETQVVQYYRDGEFITLEDNEDQENIYYLDYFNDNVVIRFNENFTIGNTISVVLYKCNGNLSSFNSSSLTNPTISDSLTYNSTDITGNIILTVDSENIYNGQDAETLQELREIGNKAFINRGVNENDFNELLAREYSSYKLKVVGGENEEEERFLGYLLYTGVNDTNSLLSISESKQVKSTIDEIRSINLRTIYRLPTIINLDYDIQLRLKTQYKGQFATYQSNITTDIQDHFNNEIYLDPLQKERDYVFNKLISMQDDIMDFVNNFSIIQYPSIRFDGSMLNFVDKILSSVELDGSYQFELNTGGDYEYNETYTDDLFSFGTHSLVGKEIWDLYYNFQIANFSGFPYIKFRLYETYIDLGTPSGSESNITYGDENNKVTQYKFPIGNDYYSIASISGATSNKIIVNKIIDNSDPSNPKAYANEVYLLYTELLDIVNSNDDYRKMFFKLYKPSGSEHFMNDITFEKDVFLLYDNINIHE